MGISMVTAKEVKNILGTFDGSIHSAINAIISTPRPIAGMIKHNNDAV